MSRTNTCDPIKMGKCNAKKRSRAEIIRLLQENSNGKRLYAIYCVDGMYLFINGKDAPTLYDHALMEGHRDPDFLGFYGRFGGWRYFSEDTELEGVA